MQCPSCGTDNAAGAVYCANCGRSLNRAGGTTGARLSWRTEEGTPQSIALSRSMTIGRTAGNDIVIPDSALSRQHARLEVATDGITIVDLGSLNGVYVNGDRVTDPRELATGDQIRIGRTTLSVEIPDEPLVVMPHESGTIRLPAAEPLAAAEGPGAPDRTIVVGEAATAGSEATVFVERAEPSPLVTEAMPVAAAAPPPGAAGQDDGVPGAAEEAGGPVSDEMTVLSPLTGLGDIQLEDLAEEPSAPLTGPVAYLVLEDIRTPLYDALTVGRAEGNAIRVENDRLMSRNHARFEARADGVWVIDLASANGTFRNDVRVVEPVRLEDNDLVRCGGTVFHFELAVRRPAPGGGDDDSLDSATLVDDEPSDDYTLQGTEADTYIREAEVAEFQAMRGGDTEPIVQQSEAPDQYRLVVNFGPEAGRSFTLFRDVTVVGRAAADADYDIQLNDRAISRPHAKIVKDADGYVIQDLESANGTWLNYTDEITAPRRLVDGDIIKMGKTTLVYRVPATIRPAAPVQVLDPEVAQVLTFFSLKGGVGTTTLAVNLAVLLRQLTNSPVLLIDLSTERGAVSVHLNLAPKLTLADLPADSSVIDADVLQSIIVPHSSGVDVLPSPPSPQSAELVTPAAIASILPIVRSRYKWVVIDTSATFSELNLGVFDQSDLLMLVCAPDLTSLKVTQATLDIFAALQIPAEKRVLVLNHVPARSHLQPEDIERTLGERIGLIVPHAGEAVLDSIDRGVPLAVANRDESMVTAMDAFAAQLAQVKREAETQARRGGFGRWVQSIMSSLRR